MTITRFLAATCSVLALAGCGTSQSSTPAESKPADVTAASPPTPATEAATPINEDVSKTPSSGDTTPIETAGVDVVAGHETLSITSVSSPPRPLATATERLTDQEINTLLERIENRRAAFEAALDDTLKNSTIKGERGDVNTNEFFDDLQDQVKRTRERFASNYSASS
jgi:hypothetical protein